MDVVAQAEDAAELLRKVRAHRPTSPSSRSTTAPRRVETWPACCMLAQAVDHERAMALLDARPAGVGYLLEHRVPDVDRFVSAVREVAAGGSVLDPAVVAEVLGRRASRDTLTEREREVLELMAGAAPTARSPRPRTCPSAPSSATSRRSSTSCGSRRPPRTHRRVLAVLSHLQMAG